MHHAVNPLYNMGDMGIVNKMAEDRGFHHIHMPKSYRSTYEITEFCNRLIKMKTDEAITVNRHGLKPQILKTAGTEHFMNIILVIQRTKQSKKSLALINSQ